MKLKGRLIQCELGLNCYLNQLTFPSKTNHDLTKLKKSNQTSIMAIPAAYKTCLKSDKCSICAHNNDFYDKYNHSCTTNDLDTLFCETILAKHNDSFDYSYRGYYVHQWSIGMQQGCGSRSIKNVKKLICVDIYSSSESYEIYDYDYSYSVGYTYYFNGSLSNSDYHSSLSHSSSFGCIKGDSDITYENVSGYDHIYKCYEDYDGYHCPDCGVGEKCGYIGYKSGEYVNCYGYCECLMSDVLCPQFKQV